VKDRGGVALTRTVLIVEITASQAVVTAASGIRMVARSADSAVSGNPVGTRIVLAAKRTVRGHRVGIGAVIRMTVMVVVAVRIGGTIVGVITKTESVAKIGVIMVVVAIVAMMDAVPHTQTVVDGKSRNGLLAI